MEKLEIDIWELNMDIPDNTIAYALLCQIEEWLEDKEGSKVYWVGRTNKKGDALYLGLLGNHSRTKHLIQSTIESLRGIYSFEAVYANESTGEVKKRLKDTEQEAVAYLYNIVKNEV